jgi:hypothetical protein
MIWNRHRNLSVVELGAINGFVFGSLLELSLRAIYVYEAYMFAQTPLPTGLHICPTSYPFSWWFLPVFSFVLATLASYLTNRCFGQLIKSSFVLWQIVGFVAILGACLYSVVAVLYHWYFGEFNFLGIDYPADVIPTELIYVLRISPGVIFFNFLFARVLRLWKKRLL